MMIQTLISRQEAAFTVLLLGHVWKGSGSHFSSDTARISQEWFFLEYGSDNGELLRKIYVVRFPLLIQLIFEFGVTEFKPNIRPDLTLKWEFTPNVNRGLPGQFCFKLYHFLQIVISNECFSLLEQNVSLKIKSLYQLLSLLVGIIVNRTRRSVHIHCVKLSANVILLHDTLQHQHLYWGVQMKHNLICVSF